MFTPPLHDYSNSVYNSVYLLWLASIISEYLSRSSLKLFDAVALAYNIPIVITK